MIRLPRAGAGIVASVAAMTAVVATPSLALAHSLGGRIDSPLPLVAYLGGAANAVGLSFFFVASAIRGRRATRNPARCANCPAGYWWPCGRSGSSGGCGSLPKP